MNNIHQTFLHTSKNIMTDNSTRKKRKTITEETFQQVLRTRHKDISEIMENTDLSRNAVYKLRRYFHTAETEPSYKDFVRKKGERRMIIRK